MTSLLGRLLPLFAGARRVEDLFTEAIARLFERRPELCLAWLRDTGIIAAPSTGYGQEYARVSSQKTFSALEHHDTDSRPDLLIEVYRSSKEDPVENSTVADVVMIESKIGSREGHEQLRRYAEHLHRMTGFESKTLVYITRGYDPRDEKEILSRVGNIRFEQLRWHDFYRFLQTVEKDALVEEVAYFMEEQGMARSYRFSAADLIVLSGVPRAFEIFDETLGGEVRAELESLASNKVRREPHSVNNIRQHGCYVTTVNLHEWDLFCFVGYGMEDPEDYPVAYVCLEAQPRAVGRDASIDFMTHMALNDGWEVYGLEDVSAWAGVYSWTNLTSLLTEEDHIAAVKRFFIESIRQLREELTEFKKEHPDLPWSGG